MNLKMNLCAELEEEDVIDKLRERLIHEELLNMQALLKSRINQEKSEIKRLMEMLTERSMEKKKQSKEKIHSPNEAEMTAMVQLVKENQLLEVRSAAFQLSYYAFMPLLFLL